MQSEERSIEIPNPYAGINRIRFNGFATQVASQAFASPRILCLDCFSLSRHSHSSIETIAKDRGFCAHPAVARRGGSDGRLTLENDPIEPGWPVVFTVVGAVENSVGTTAGAIHIVAVATEGAFELAASPHV